MATTAPAVPAGTLTDSLAHAVRRAKGADVLAPVTVVAASGHAATWTRRAALLELAGSGQAGTANVHVVTVDVLVGQLAGRPGAEPDDPVARSQRAIAAAGRATLPALGAVVLVELPTLDDPDAAVVNALAARDDVTVLGVSDPPPCTDLYPCATRADEARTAVRALVSGLEGGVALWRQAVLHPAGSSYGRLVHEALHEAGMDSCGPAVLPLRDSVAGRLVLGFLDLCDGDLRRDEVTAWMASAPLVAGHERTPVPSERWDALSARAGVRRGLEQWRASLARLATLDESSADDTARLSDFVEELAGVLVPPSAPRWSAWAGWLADAVTRLVGTPGPRSWPARERQALDQVDGAVRALARHDDRGEPPTLDTVRRMVGFALEDRLLDTGVLGPSAFGHGAFVAPFGLARGMRFDTVVLVGLDAVGDGPAHDDHAVGDAARAGVRRRLATFVESGRPTSRSGGPPGALVGRVDATTLLHPPVTLATDVQHLGPPLDRTGLALRAMESVRRRHGDMSESLPVRADARLTAGVEAVRARTGRTFSRFDGWTGPGTVDVFDPERPLSPTRVETYAECPRRFFFDRVLGVQPRLRPEGQRRMDPRARGSLVHAVLERYVMARLAGAPPSLELLLALADDVVDTAMVGASPVLWRVEREGLARDLRQFHADEGDDQPLAAEFAFGTGEPEAAPAVEVTLPDARTVRFQGRVDRVDRSTQGELVVSDYKTGRQTGLARLLSDPLDGGRRLQLPLYVLAARSRFGQDDAVRARYWVISPERQVASYSLRMTDELEQHFRDVVGRLSTAVDSGVFPGVPGLSRAGSFERCGWCDYDLVCPTGRARQWRTKRGDPLLAPVARLTDMTVPDTVAGAVVAGSVDPGDGVGEGDGS